MKNTERIAKWVCATSALGIMIVLIAKPLPNPPQTAYVPVETETETMTTYTMEAYLHSMAVEENEKLLERVEEAHEMATEPQTEEETEGYQVFEFIDLSEDLQKEIFALCKAYEIDYTFYIGWMFTESRCHWSIGADNDTGFMQIIPRFHQASAEAMGIDIYSELGNCEYAMVLLNDYLAQNAGDLRRALTQYNTGSPDANNGYADRVFANVEWVRTHD